LWQNKARIKGARPPTYIIFPLQSPTGFIPDNTTVKSIAKSIKQ
jgi:hypothetical protein